MPDIFDIVESPGQKPSGDIFDSITSDSGQGAAFQAAEEQQAMERNAAQTATVGNARNTVRDMLDTGTEGVARGLLGPASMLLSKEQLQKPRVSPEVMKYAMIYPKVADIAAEAFPNSPVQYVKPVTDAMANTASGFTSAQNIGLLGLAPGSQTAQRLVAGTFLGQSIVGTPEQWQAFNEAKAVPEKIRIATEMGLSLALPTMALAHSRAGGFPKPKSVSEDATSVRLSTEPPSFDNQATSLSVPPEVLAQNEVAPQKASPSVDESTARYRPRSNEPNIESQPEVTTPIVEPQRVSGEKEAVSEPVEAQGQKKPFVPSTEWQEVPEGTVLPNGGEYRFDQKSGKNFARWKPENLPKESQAADSPPSVSQSADQPDIPRPIRPVPESVPNESRQQRAEADVVPSSRLVPDERSSMIPQRETTPTPDETSRVGIAHEYGEERFPDQIERGEGTTVEAQVERGRELLRRGTDPGQIVRRVEKTGRVSGDDMSVLRAQLETFQHAADTAAEASRTNPGDPVLKRAAEQAMQNELAWRKTIKPAATAFHEIGMTLQGQAEVNYGTLEGLRRSAFDLHGKDVNPAQAARLNEVATRVRRETQLATESLQRATTQIENTLGRKRPARSVEQLRNDLANRLRELTPC